LCQNFQFKKFDTKSVAKFSVQKKLQQNLLQNFQF